MSDVRYVSVTDGYIAKVAGHSPTNSASRPLLLGARLHVDTHLASSSWAPARTMPNKKDESRSGFVQLNHISDRQQLKVFYTDVGQGDATLIEAEGGIVIIDGGPSRGFYDVLKDRLAGLRRADVDLGNPPREQLRIDAIIISHFDKDHYYGLRSLFGDDDFVVGTLYHNGLPRYGKDSNKDLELGDVTHHQDGTVSISTDLTDTTSAQEMIDNDLLLSDAGGQNLFNKFMQAVIGAEQAGRLGGMKRLFRRHTTSSPNVINDVGSDLVLEVLAPITTKTTGAIRLPVFPDPHDISDTNLNPDGSESHTINGNSIVIRLRYGSKTFLFGGDLNQPAQKYLDAKYGATNPFTADVNKACHHGSSDFDLKYLKYLKDVNPSATVFSSGDNGSYDHPLPDAMGTAAKHSSGDFPLVFSTELARDNKTSGKILLGHINARSNGTDVVMAQKKEKAGNSNPWHTFSVPYSGPFGDH